MRLEIGSGLDARIARQVEPELDRPDGAAAVMQADAFVERVRGITERVPQAAGYKPAAIL